MTQIEMERRDAALEELFELATLSQEAPEYRTQAASLLLLYVPTSEPAPRQVEMRDGAQAAMLSLLSERGNQPQVRLDAARTMLRSLPYEG